MITAYETFFRPDSWMHKGQGARYLQLARHIGRAIDDGSLEKGQQLPAERDLAEMAEVSRVTVRKAVAELVGAGLIEQRRGAGSFVLGAAPKTQQSLLSLISFTENMQARGRVSTSRVLKAELVPPSPDETMALGLSLQLSVARIERLRSADGTPMAIERSSLPSDILPDPESVTTSLYAVLRRRNLAPSRAVQRVSAVNVTGENARLLSVAENTALLKIDRTAFLDSGRPIEFTRGLYRPDIYDFVAEIRPDGGGAQTAAMGV